MTDQPVFVLGSELQALEPAGFETEAEFQELLARHPRVLDFGSLSDGQPLRLVLVAREMGVPTSAENGPTYWLDHLFVDADGVPTLVEVKRANDTRIRREVVGQMLDYAANGARYWPGALLQRSFEETCVADGRPLEEAYGELLGDRSPEDFWSMVEERLAVGQMRLLFVADRIPLELRAIVEFLNRQMRQTDVYAVELTQYRGAGDLRVLVPRIHGEIATVAKSPSGRRTTQRTTRADMEEEMQKRLDPAVLRAARALLDHATARGRLEGGTAKYPSMSVYYRVAGRQVPIWTLSLYANPAKDELSFSFGSINHHLSLKGAAAFADSLPPVPGLEQKLEAQREKGYNGWPSVSLAALAAEPNAVEGILSAIQQLMDGQEASV
ncbi:hypothetical protein [Streptomyces albireticuli]|uniref:Uncharacterized protein n=1 Tax=Streptomyces albireticuli TaxID=1940 RepID=A0A2A2D1K8_9ACTN|nr:hypothetical protein [Streptomyces albireticuli]MCD9145155.1 hypothetical protein [Streptomyces albireticuli]MCD9164670.1 hypothetical protein [Streptomyces albireticuli]MCD9194935.1 hypothetical protein [Streptomyces albireticuli]PAU45394.1 hypothetical protein CK936_29385 [Streptomyces albireticuli]